VAAGTLRVTMVIAANEAIFAAPPDTRPQKDAH
jgi:hypothetical protein